MGRHRSVGTLRKVLSSLRLAARTHTISAPRSLTIELVDVRTDMTDRVTDEAFGAGKRASGRYQAVCGMEVLPASLTAPARSHCLTCERDG